MALTVSDLSFNNVGAQAAAEGTLTFDASYPAGGESLTARQIGLEYIDNIQLQSDDGYVIKYGKANAKLQAFYTAFAGSSVVGIVGCYDRKGLINQTTF